MRILPILPLLVILSIQVPVPTGVVESPRSDIVTLPPVVLKWDQPAKSLEELQSFRWAAYISTDITERVELPEVTCGPPSGKTPLTLWSCEMPMRPAWVGKHIQVVAYIAAPALLAPRAIRLVGLPPEG